MEVKTGIWEQRDFGLLGSRPRTNIDMIRSRSSVARQLEAALFTAV